MAIAATGAVELFALGSSNHTQVTRINFVNGNWTQTGQTLPALTASSGTSAVAASDTNHLYYHDLQAAQLFSFTFGGGVWTTTGSFGTPGQRILAPGPLASMKLNFLNGMAVIPGLVPPAVELVAMDQNENGAIVQIRLQ
jgi:hypothetical protein